VNTSQQNMQNEPQISREKPVLGSEETTELSASLPTTEPEIQEVFHQIASERSRGHFADYLRYLLRYEERKPVDPTFALHMTIDEMLAVLRQESRKRARWKKVSIGIGVSLIVLVLSVSIYGRSISVQSLFALLAPLSLLFAATAASQKQQAVVAAITQFDDVRAVGPLAEALEFPGEHIAPIVQKTLIRLLSRLKASDASLLKPAQRACLNRAIQGGNTELTLAILKAWEQIGDADAIPEVQRLAEGRDLNASLAETDRAETQRQVKRKLWAKTAKRLTTILIGERRPGIANADRPRLIAAAQECLPVLRQSVENRQIGAQLLRPADSHRISSDVLLRPSTTHVSTDPPEQLLRSTDTS